MKLKPAKGEPRLQFLIRMLPPHLTNTTLPDRLHALGASLNIVKLKNGCINYQVTSAEGEIVAYKLSSAWNWALEQQLKKEGIL